MLKFDIAKGTKEVRDDYDNRDDDDEKDPGENAAEEGDWDEENLPLPLSFLRELYIDVRWCALF